MFAETFTVLLVGFVSLKETMINSTSALAWIKDIMSQRREKQSEEKCKTV